MSDKYEKHLQELYEEQRHLKALLDHPSWQWLSDECARQAQQELSYLVAAVSADTCIANEIVRARANAIARLPAAIEDRLPQVSATIRMLKEPEGDE